MQSLFVFMKQKYIFILLKNLPPSSTSFFWWKCSRGSWEEATVFTFCFVCQNLLFLKKFFNQPIQQYLCSMISTFSPILDWRRKVPPPQTERQKLWKHGCILKLLAGFGSRDMNPRARDLQSTLLWRQTAKASEPLALPWLPVGTLWGQCWYLQAMPVNDHNCITSKQWHLLQLLSYSLSYSSYIFPVSASAMFHEPWGGGILDLCGTGPTSVTCLLCVCLSWVHPPHFTRRGGFSN